MYCTRLTKAPLFLLPLSYARGFDWLKRNVCHNSTLSFPRSLHNWLRDFHLQPGVVRPQSGSDHESFRVLQADVQGVVSAAHRESLRSSVGDFLGDHSAQYRAVRLDYDRPVASDGYVDTVLALLCPQCRRFLWPVSFRVRLFLLSPAPKQRGPLDLWLSHRWSTQSFAPEEMTPLWTFPTYPFLLVGPLASVLCSSIDPTRTLDIAIGGSIFQGVGFMISFMIDGVLIYRLMTQKLPQQALRPSMFISVGPVGFTATSILGISDQLQSILPSHITKQGGTLLLSLIGRWIGILLWG